MTRSVTDSWALLHDWMRRNVPHVHAMLAPPATAADLHAVEQAHGIALPGDLAAWWRGANGMSPGTMSYAQIVPPGLAARSTRSAIEHLDETRQIAIDTAPYRRFHYEQVAPGADAAEYDAAVAAAARRPAGSPPGEPEQTLLHLPEWVLFAWESGGYFVDCRAGALHGCVMWQGAHGGWSGPLWPSVAAMWEETSDVLLGLDAGARPESVPTSAGEWWFPRGWWPGN